MQSTEPAIPTRDNPPPPQPARTASIRRHVLWGAAITALAYFQRKVPETKNRSLQDIERNLDVPARRKLPAPVRLPGAAGTTRTSGVALIRHKAAS